MGDDPKALAIGLVLTPAFGEKGSFIPLGLASLNGALRQAGYQPTYHDVSASIREKDPHLYAELVRIGFSPDEGGFFGPDFELLLAIGRRGSFQKAELADAVLERAREAAAELIDLDLALLTLWDSNLIFAAALGCALREQGCRVVLGGPGAQLEPLRELLCRIGAADAVLSGEGEERVVAIANNVGETGELGEVAGATFLDANGGVVHREPAVALRIHDLPWPSFDGFPVDDWLPVITSRGCIRDCSFCTEKDIWSRYRQRKVEDVIDELESLIEKHGVRRFEFNDDLLNGHPKWLERFCDALIARDWGLRWICFMEPYRLSPDLLDKVAQAGCTLIKFGVQHFDPDMLRVIGRGDEIEEVMGTLEGVANRGVRVHFDLIPGHPGESEQQHLVNLNTLPRVLETGDLLEVNINPFLLLYGAPVEKNPSRYGAVVQRWEPRLLPDELQADLTDLAPLFIRSYEQDPPRAVVIERARQLEAVVRRVRNQRVFPVMAVGEDGLDQQAVVTLRSRGAHRILLRAAEGATPRGLLDGISSAREHGFPVVAMESGGSPFDRVVFVKEAAERGLHYAILNAQGDPETAVRAGTLLAAGGIRWILNLSPGPGSLFELRAWVERGVRAKAHGVLLCLDRAVGSAEGVQMSEVVVAARRALEHGDALGIQVHVYGLPFCALPEYLDSLLAVSPFGSKDQGEEVMLKQAPVCRSCSWANRCPGVADATLAREGMEILEPIPGRPVDDDGKDTIEQLFA